MCGRLLPLIRLLPRARICAFAFFAPCHTSLFVSVFPFSLELFLLVRGAGLRDCARDVEIAGSWLVAHTRLRLIFLSFVRVCRIAKGEISIFDHVSSSDSEGDDAHNRGLAPGTSRSRRASPVPSMSRDKKDALANRYDEIQRVTLVVHARSPCLPCLLFLLSLLPLFPLFSSAMLPKIPLIPGSSHSIQLCCRFLRLLPAPYQTYDAFPR